MVETERSELAGESQCEQDVATFDRALEGAMCRASRAHERMFARAQRQCESSGKRRRAGFYDSTVRSSWAPSTAVLRKYARTHVWYEIDSLLGQLERLESLFPNGDLGNDYVGRALAEACLLHLRVLNDFLAGERHSNQRAKRGHPDVFAAHWLEAWKTRPFLTSAQERRLSRQLAHLSGKRYWPYPWDMHKMTVSGCRALARFLEELDRAHPTRARWFADSRRLVDNFLALETREGSRR